MCWSYLSSKLLRRLTLNPPTGAGPLRFGMPLSEAIDAASAWGDVRVGEPAPGRVGYKVLIAHRECEIVLLADDGRTLTGIEAWRFERDDADVLVEYEDIDIFRTPARDVVQCLDETGHAGDTSDEEVAVYPDLGLLLSRETSRDVPADPHDGQPLHFHYALAAPSGYFN
jgi:hypothetical protein